MATAARLSKYEVVYSPGGDLYCGLCEDILLEPQSTTCCGNQCCKPCIQMSVVSEARCPYCKSSKLAIISNEKLQAQLDQLMIKCSNFEAGCDWEGQVSGLQVHLDKQCLYTLQTCSQGCEMIIQRKKMDEHKMTTCINRKRFCKHCSREFTSIRLESHEKICKEKKKKVIRRKKIEKEMGVTTCPYSVAGCSEVMDTGNVASHLQLAVHRHEWLETTLSNYIKHMEYNSTRHTKQLKDMELKLKKAEIAAEKASDEAVKLKQEKRVLKSEHDLALRDLKLMEIYLSEKNQEILGLTNQLNSHNTQVSKRTTFLITNFSKFYNADEKATWVSDSFFTHQNGYKLCVKVDCPVGTIRMRLHLLPGPHDDDLQWPLQGNITLSIMNQVKDEHHWENKFVYDSNTPPEAANRVMDANSESFARHSNSRDLPLSKLKKSEWDCYTSPLYIINNTILIEVTNAKTI